MSGAYVDLVFDSSQYAAPQGGTPRAMTEQQLRDYAMLAPRQHNSQAEPRVLVGGPNAVDPSFFASGMVDGWNVNSNPGRPGKQNAAWRCILALLLLDRVSSQDYLKRRMPCDSALAPLSAAEKVHAVPQD